MTTLRVTNRSLARMMIAAVFLCATMWLNQAPLKATVHQCGQEEVPACGYSHFGIPYCAEEGDCIEAVGDPQAPWTFIRCTCYEGNCDWIEDSHC